MKTTNAQYWLCQIAGWGAYSFGAGLSTGVMANGWRPSVVSGYLLFFLYSIGLTHLLRTEIHRRNWTSLSLLRALLRTVPASILIAAVQVLWLLSFTQPSRDSSANGGKHLPSRICS